MLDVAVIGLGFMGEIHTRIYDRLKGVRLVAAADVRPERRTLLAKDVSTKYFNTGDDLLRETRPDIIDICLPTFLHPSYVKKALNKGCHVLCEKPIALSSREGLAMTKLAKLKKRFLMIGQVLRFWPEYVAMKKILDSGKFGKAKYFHAARFVSPTWPWEGWLFDPKRSGGAVTDLHIHDLDACLWFFGLPKTILAAGHPWDTGAYHHSQTFMSFPKGVSAMAEGGFGVPLDYPFTMGFRLHLEDATVDYNIHQSPTLRIMAGRKGKPVPVKIGKDDGYTAEIKYFIDCVKKNKAPERNPAKESVQAVRMVEHVLSSLKTGKLKKYNKI